MMAIRLLLWAGIISCFLFPSAAATAERDQPTLTELGRDLKSDDGNTRRKAVEGLGGFREPEAVKLLADAYRSEERDAFGVKAACALALGRTGLPEAATPLAGMLADPDYWVRKRAAEALADIPGDAAFQALQKASGDSDPRVRARAVLSLGNKSGGTALIRKALTDRDDRVIAAGIEALDAAKDPGAGQIIGEALSHSSPQVRHRAARLLARRGDPRGLQALEADIRSGADQGEAIKEAASVGDAAVPVLGRLAAERQNPERQKILEALETMDCPAATAFFADLATNTGAAAEDRLRATMVLFDRRQKLDRSQVQSAASLLEDKDANLVGVALQILLDAGGPEYSGRIVSLAKREEEVIRHFAIANLARHGRPEHEDALAAALSGANGATIRLALEGLARVGSRKSLPTIQGLTQDMKYKRFAQAAIEAIQARP